MARSAHLLSRLGTIAAIFSIAHCAEPTGLDGSATQSFAATNKTTNVIAAFLGSSDGIPGTLRDIPNMQRVINPANGFNFQYLGGSGFTNATTSTIMQQSAAAARQMLDADMAAYAKLQRGGTLFWYITSHGSPGGYSVSSDGQFQFNEVTRAMTAARTVGGRVVPLERLIVMFDTCFSGSNAGAITNSAVVPGASAPLANPFSQLFSLADPLLPAPAPVVNRGMISAPTPAPVIPTGEGEVTQNQFINATIQQAQAVSGLYKSAIFIAASKPGEMSGDGSDGGVGTSAFLAAINNVKNSHGTVKQLLDGMRAGAMGQTPTWCVDPPELLTDFVMDPPPGALPQVYGNAAAEGSRRKTCSAEITTGL